MSRELSVPELHQKRIALKTLRMSDTGALIMGGMTKAQAREFLSTRAGWSKVRLAAFEGDSDDAPDCRADREHDSAGM